MKSVRQFKTFMVCQVCGRATPVEQSAGWLSQPHRDRWDVNVTRCPQHWSEWALRHTREGRTKENRRRMAEALAMPVPEFPIFLQPFPTREQEN
jgi:hypothetical protein